MEHKKRQLAGELVVEQYKGQVGDMPAGELGVGQ